MLQSGVIHMSSWSTVSELWGVEVKIVSANISTEPSCELAASSSQNSLPGGSFMEINTDLKKALRGGCTCCVSGLYSNTK